MFLLILKNCFDKLIESEPFIFFFFLCKFERNQKSTISISFTKKLPSNQSALKNADSPNLQNNGTPFYKNIQVSVSFDLLRVYVYTGHVHVIKRHQSSEQNKHTDAHQRLGLIRAFTICSKAFTEICLHFTCFT